MSVSKWPFQEAKKRLSVVVRKAQRQGPQVITLHGKDAAVVVSVQDFGKLPRHKGRLVDFFRKSPLVGLELSLTRSRDTGQNIDT